MYRRWPCLTGIILLTILLLAIACGSEQKPTLLPGCESAPRPVVFVHGMMGGGDNYANTVMRFTSNGYCPEYLRVFDWNTLFLDMERNAETLGEFVDQVLEETGSEQIDLVGHSMGGGLSQRYLADEKNAAKVSHYVRAASSCSLEFSDSVPMLVLSSGNDSVFGACTMEGAQNEDVEGADHLQLVTLPEVFEAMYRFFNDGQPPTTLDFVSEDVPTLMGRVLTFGTNLPVADAVVEVYPVDPVTGERLSATPAGRFSSGEDGAWGPFQADPVVHYEFLVYEDGRRPFHYYRQPFPRSNPVVYLRVLPKSDLLLSRILGDLRYDDGSSNVVFFSANQVLYYGRDTATVDGFDLATPEMAPPPPDKASTIAIFILDVDGNGQTDGGPVLGPLADTLFLQQYDAFLDASSRRTVMLTMNDATLNVPTWKADSEGVIIAVFD